MTFKQFSKLRRGLAKNILILGVMLVMVFWPFSGVQASSLSDLEQQQADLQKQIQAIQQSLNAKQKEVSNNQDLVNQLQDQIAATQEEIGLENQQISVLNQQIAALNDQITQKEAELAVQKDNLAETLKTLYEEGNQSSLEIILGSNSLSDVVTREQDLSAISSSINDNINTITQIENSLKADQSSLQTQQTNLSNTVSSLTDKQRNLNIQQQRQSALLAQAAAQQAQIQSNLNSTVADQDNVSAQIYALRQASGGYTSGGTGGYPFANSTPDMPDPWGFYTRECTSYAAWYFNDIEGKYWYNTRPGSGSAWNWPALAADQGYSVSSTPRAGAIASWPAGGIFGSYGHVAIVMSVNANGTINVSEYNWVKFAYDERYNVSPSGARFIF